MTEKIEDRLQSCQEFAYNILSDYYYTPETLRGKWKTITLYDLCKLMDIYELIKENKYKKAWSKIEDLDSIVRDDFLDKKVYAILEKHFA